MREARQKASVFKILTCPHRLRFPLGEEMEDVGDGDVALER